MNPIGERMMPARPVGERMADIRNRALDSTIGRQTQPEKEAEALAVSSPLRKETVVTEEQNIPQIREDVNLPTLTDSISEKEYLAGKAAAERGTKTMRDPATNTERAVASTAPNPEPFEYRENVTELIQRLKSLEAENTRLLAEIRGGAEQPVDSPETTTAAKVEVEEQAPKLPEGPEDAAYDSLKENWKTLRTAYEEQERTYHEALRTELDTQAKSWNPLKSIPYAARKMFGFNQKLSPELEAMKVDATTSAMLYRDASQALAAAKRDTLLRKFENLNVGGKNALDILTRHDRMLGRKLVLTRAQEQLSVMRQAPSLTEHPRMQKAMEILANNKYKVMAGTVGVAALTGAFLPVLAAIGTGVAVRKGLGGKIESLLTRAADRANVQVDIAEIAERAGIASYDDMLRTTERALEKEAMAQKHANYTNAAAFGAAVAAGGVTAAAESAYSGMTQNLADVAAETPLGTPLHGIPSDTPTIISPEEMITRNAEVMPVVPPQEVVPSVPAPEVVPPAVLSPEASVYAIKPGDTLWDITKANLATEVGAPTDTQLMGFRNYLASNPAVLDEIGVHTSNPDVIRPGVDSIDLQKLKDAYAQYADNIAIAPPPEVIPAVEVPAAEATQASEMEVAPLTPEEMPAVGEVAPADPAVAAIVQDIETFNVEKPGFLNLFSTTELQTTSGQLFDTMKSLTLSDVEKIYTDQAFRTQVFPNGVSQEALTRWVNWIQEQNATIPAYTNLTLGAYVASVAGSRNQ